MPKLDYIPVVPYLSGPCQRFSNIGAHGPAARVSARVRFGLGIREALGRLRGQHARGTTEPPHLGQPSRYAVGDWVRVVDEQRLRASLDSRARLRGLEFSPQQWFSCGRTYRVSTIVRRIIDDDGRLRPVSRTVLLDDVDCGGEHGQQGCGRFCPMFFRDEWIEPTVAPTVPVRSDLPDHGFARVRSIADIQRTLDALGRRDSLLFMPEMARFSGQVHRVKRTISRVWELERWVETPTAVYILEGIRCSGTVLREQGPCDRRCHALWHRDWLQFDSSPD